MERFALIRYLQRRRQFVQHLAPCQPWNAYVARQRLLTRALGLLPGPSASAPLPLSPALAGEAGRFLPVDTALPYLEQSALDPRENDPLERFVSESVQQPIQTMANDELVIEKQDIPSPHTDNRETDGTKVDEAQDWPPVRSLEEAKLASLPDQASPVAPEIEQDARAHRVLGTHEAEERLLIRQENRKSEPLPGKPGMRQRRIEERPLSSATVRPEQGKPSEATTSQKPGHSRSDTRGKQQTEAQRDAEREAADLFTPGPQNRSPQEWLALLIPGDQKQQPETLAQPDISQRSEQPVNAIQPVQRRQPVPHPGRERRPVQRNAPMLAPGQGAVPFAPPVALPERTPAARFIPAQRQGTREKRAEFESGTDLVASDTTAAEPVSMRARRFLKPFIGADPREIRVHRGPASARFVSAQRADAVTVGDEIFLAAGHAGDEPETLGLLAHELTHVMRSHDPRFIPPVVDGRDSSAMATHDTSPAAHDYAVAPPASIDEEELALLVEHQVARQARNSAEQLVHTPPVQAGLPVSLETQASPARQAAVRTSWGGLPAPWEPLPTWLVSAPVPLQPPQPSATHDGSDTSHWGSAASTPMSSNAGMSAGAGQKATPVVQRAGLERGREHAQEQTAQQESLLKQREPDPDLDQLARQVYMVLKRRLDVERRRIS